MAVAAPTFGGVMDNSTGERRLCGQPRTGVRFPPPPPLYLGKDNLRTYSHLDRETVVVGSRLR